MSSDFVNGCYSSYKETFIAGSGILVTFHWQGVVLIFIILSGNAMDIFWFVLWYLSCLPLWKQQLVKCPVLWQLWHLNFCAGQ